MAQTEHYKGHIIKSTPIPLKNGDGYSANGIIEEHASTGVRNHLPVITPPIKYSTETKADKAYIDAAKNFIDGKQRAGGKV
jgi:hypothetical protein